MIKWNRSEDGNTSSKCDRFFISAIYNSCVNAQSYELYDTYKKLKVEFNTQKECKQHALVIAQTSISYDGDNLSIQEVAKLEIRDALDNWFCCWLDNETAVNIEKENNTICKNKVFESCVIYQQRLLEILEELE